MDDRLPAAVITRLGPDIATAVVTDQEAITHGTGAATGAVTRLCVRLEGPRGTSSITMLRKRLAPLTEGRHAVGADDPRHWAYWRRETEAYRAELVPRGPGLRAPRCYAIVDDDLYLEEVTGETPSVERAAQALARWQRPRDDALDHPWLCSEQLATRVAASDLDWSQVDADPRMPELWDRRLELLERLHGLPRVLSHGDYSLGNLIDAGGDVVVLDWATVGWEPLGFDLAHLALSAGEDPTDAYLGANSPPVADRALLLVGFRIAVALIGSSRLHWMIARDREPPSWYADFIWTHRPDGPA